jgi:hypothetical protein
MSRHTIVLAVRLLLLMVTFVQALAKECDGDVLAEISAARSHGKFKEEDLPVQPITIRPIMSVLLRFRVDALVLLLQGMNDAGARSQAAHLMLTRVLCCAGLHAHVAGISRRSPRTSSRSC